MKNIILALSLLIGSITNVSAGVDSQGVPFRLFTGYGTFMFAMPAPPEAAQYGITEYWYCISNFAASGGDGTGSSLFMIEAVTTSMTTNTSITVIGGNESTCAVDSVRLNFN
ncbi:MAG: hypothetical protein QM479_07925 [Pseudomonadota bacterium]